jgi:aspartate kinase
MTVAILKFGGTSLSTVDRVIRVAEIVRAYQASGLQPVVVVSAMEGITNQLVGYARGLGQDQPSPEQDLVFSTGEQVAAGLLALCLNQQGGSARSFLAWQVPILTNGHHAHATIESIGTDALLGCLAHGIIPVVAGYQGVTHDQRITTLGRGGSDLTAVALATALKTDLCHIYTDVDGVYSADPARVPSASRLDSIPASEMLPLARGGAKVLQERSVAWAVSHRVPIRVLSSFHPPTIPHWTGTLITVDATDSNIRPSVRAIASRSDDAVLSVHGLSPQNLHDLSTVIPHESVELHHQDGVTTILLSRLSMQPIQKDLARLRLVQPEIRIQMNPNVGRVQIVGPLIQHLSLEDAVRAELKPHRIETFEAFQSHCSQTFVIPEAHVDRLVERLHHRFMLGRSHADAQIA